MYFYTIKTTFYETKNSYKDIHLICLPKRWDVNNPFTQNVLFALKKLLLFCIPVDIFVFVANVQNCSQIMIDIKPPLTHNHFISMEFFAHFVEKLHYLQLFTPTHERYKAIYFLTQRIVDKKLSYNECKNHQIFTPD